MLLHTDALANDPGLPPLSTSESLQFADVDGDGRADACAHDGSGVRCYLHAASDGSYSCGLISNAVLAVAGFDSTWMSSPSHWQTIQYPDVDGDGIADVCGRGHEGIYCATGAGNLADTSQWLDGFTDADGWHTDPAYWKTIQFPDVDGDGRDDICGRGIDGISCALSTGSSFGSLELWSDSFSDADQWNSDPSLWSTIQFADIDDDGDDDVCGRGFAGVYCARSLANVAVFGFEAPPTLWTSQFSSTAGWTAPQYYETIQLADVNGDRAADICGRGSAGVYCGISVLTEFEKADQLNISGFSDGSGYNVRNRYETLRLVDVSGDGNADACARGSDGIYCAEAKKYFEGFVSGWSDLFHGAEFWANDFGDDKNWDDHEQYWGTVQPATVFGSEPGAVFCGRGALGIYCQNPWRMKVVPEHHSDCDPWPEDPPAEGALKTAVILYRFDSNNNGPGPTVAQVQQIVSTRPDSADAYLQDFTFGAVSLRGATGATVDIFSNNGAPFVAPSGDHGAIDDEFLDVQAGIAPGDYDFIVYWRPTLLASETPPEQGAEVWSGNFYNSQGRVVVRSNGGNLPPSVVAHELLHAMGVNHANAYDCWDDQQNLITFTSAPGSCCWDDLIFNGTRCPAGYGNGYDVMGSSAGGHPGAYFKARLGLFYSDQIYTIPAQTARPWEDTFTLESITQSSDGLKVLRIPLPIGLIPASTYPGVRFYVYVEHRTAGLFEPATVANNGVVLTFGGPLYVNADSFLVNTSPGTPGRVASPVGVGETFTHEELGFEIEVLAVDGDGASVRVRLPGEGSCGNGVVDGLEECDDGASADVNCCSSACEMLPAGTSCGDPSDTECTDPDTCDGAGSCVENDEPGGTACTDGKVCTDNDSCQDGVCMPGECATDRQCAVCGAISTCSFRSGTCACYLSSD
ncbi:MAG: VCBS repeat-containing protein [Candidatus Binatia bacterium]|nr:VCBS repeat-containing protein [Candidatus Binatia bacterium]